MALPVRAHLTAHTPSYVIPASMSPKCPAHDGMHSELSDLRTVRFSLAQFTESSPSALQQGKHADGTELLLRSICLLASFVFSIGAIIFMWFLYPKQYDYTAQLSKSMFFYEANMVRALVCLDRQRKLCSPLGGNAMTATISAHQPLR